MGLGAGDLQCPEEDKYFSFGADLFAALLALQAVHVSFSRTAMVQATTPALSCMLQHSALLREYFQSEASPVLTKHGGGRGLKMMRGVGAAAACRFESAAAIVMAHTLGVILLGAEEVEMQMAAAALPASKKEEAANSKWKTAEENRSKTSRRYFSFSFHLCHFR